MNDFRTSFKQGEWRFVFYIMAIVLGISTLPYIFAMLTTPTDKHFVGFILNTSDHAQYLAWYRGFQNSFLISNPLTPEVTPPIFFNLLWFSLGLLGRITGWSYNLVYQLFRLSVSAFFLITLYAFSALFFTSMRVRRVAFSITALCSGLGWIWVVLKYTLTPGDLLYPFDVYVAEGNSFLGMMAYPHFIEAAALILVVLGLLLLGERAGQLRYAVAAGFVAHFLGWQHGYDLLIVWGIPIIYGAYKLVEDRRWPKYWIQAILITILLSWPPALYSVLLTQFSPAWKEVLSQFSNAGAFTPDPLHLVILMGLPLVLAIFTFILRAIKSPIATEHPMEVRSYSFIGVWFVAGGLMAYIPTDFQIHMLNSWQIPIGFLATIGLIQYLWPTFSRWSRIRVPQRVFVILFIACIAITNVYLWTWRFVDLNRHDYPYFLDNSEIAALDWLETHTPFDAVVLSSHDIGRYIPGLSGRRPFLSHWAQTLDFYDKQERVLQFFDVQTDDTERLETLMRFGVDYVFYGPIEEELGKFSPDESAILNLVFSNDVVKIFEFINIDSQTE